MHQQSGRGRPMNLTEALSKPSARRQGTVDLTPDGAQINNVVVEGEINDDWSRVFELFNLDHTQFEVVDDTVRMSTWQQSARGRDGDRDGVQLYSYSARFRRVRTASKVDVTELLRQLRGARRPAARKTTTGRTRVVIVSDAQVGKVDERGGTKELLARISYLLGELENECRLVKCDDAVILDPGDLLEGFENTGAEAFTNDLSLPEQLRWRGGSSPKRSFAYLGYPRKAQGLPPCRRTTQRGVKARRTSANRVTISVSTATLLFPR